MRLRIRNQQGQPVPFTITDRATEIKTTSLGAPSNVIPPMSVLTFTIQEGEDIVLGHDGNLSVVKEEIDV